MRSVNAVVPARGVLILMTIRFGEKRSPKSHEAKLMCFPLFVSFSGSLVVRAETIRKGN